MTLKINKNKKMEDILLKCSDNLNEIQYKVIYSEACEYLKNKWNELIMKSDLTDSYKSLMKKASVLYLEKMYKLGFINKENIKYILELLENNITGFEQIYNEPNVYAAWRRTSGKIGYNENKNVSEDRAIRTIFHEFNHTLISRKLEGKNPIFESGGHFEIKDLKKSLKSRKITLPNHKDIAGILDEYLAEEMAQQLWYEDDAKRPEKTVATPFGGLKFDRQIYSNLEPGYNRCYQQIMEEFLKNIRGINTSNNNTNEKRARALFNVCLSKSNMEITSALYKQYNSNDERHKRKLFITLGNIVGRVGNNKIISSELCYSDSEIFNILGSEHINDENHRIKIQKRDISYNEER